MNAKILVLSLVTSALVNMQGGFAKNFLQLRHNRFAKNKRIEIYPVKYSQNDNQRDDNCFDYQGKCLLPLTKKPIVVLKDFNFVTTLNEGPEIRINLDEKASKSIEKNTRKYLNSRFAIVYDGKVLHVPHVLKDNKKKVVNMFFNNQDNFEKTYETLLKG